MESFGIFRKKKVFSHWSITACSVPLAEYCLSFCRRRGRKRQAVAHSLLEKCHSSGDTGRAHSGNFVFETLCSENNFISDIYEDLCYVFVFGYYLKRTISNMHTNEKKAGFHNLSQGRKGPSQEVV